MNTTQQLPEEVLSGQQPVQPTVLKRWLQPHGRMRRRLLTLVSLLLLGGMFMGIAVASGWGVLSLFWGYSKPAATSRQLSLPQQTGSSGPSPSVIKGTVQGFMDAMLQKHWTIMWSLLHPDAQQFWQGEQDFVHFEQEKFGALHIP
jgi:hypothetical protein